MRFIRQKRVMVENQHVCDGIIRKRYADLPAVSILIPCHGHERSRRWLRQASQIVNSSMGQLGRQMGRAYWLSSLA